MSDLKNFLNKQAPDSKAQAPDSAAGAGEESKLQAPETATVTEDVDFPFSRQYTSHPISNYGIGRFVFEKGLLTLTSQRDADEFEAILAEQPEIERSRIKLVNLSMAEEISRQFQRQGGATKQIDSTTGDRGVKPMTGKGSMELGDRGEVK